jgi:hypothetical protein
MNSTILPVYYFIKIISLISILTCFIFLKIQDVLFNIKLIVFKIQKWYRVFKVEYKNSKI